MFGRQHVNINNLKEGVLIANHWWDSIPANINLAYDALMLNEAYWEYPTHNEFSRLATWCSLGNA